MSRVSYQLPDDEPAPVAADYAPPPPGAISTRKRDATVAITVMLSPAQARWLKRLDRTKAGAAGSAVRALVDLGMELDVDWTPKAGAAVRSGVHDAVRVRRTTG